MKSINKIITLHDGSKVDEDFYEFIKDYVVAQYDFLNPEDSHRIEDILGAELIDDLTESACQLAYKSFIRMVENFEVPYEEFAAPSKYYTYYTLMPTMPSVFEEVDYFEDALAV